MDIIYINFYFLNFQNIGTRGLFEIFPSDAIRAAIGGAGMVGVLNVGYIWVNNYFNNLINK